MVCCQSSLQKLFLFVVVVIVVVVLILTLFLIKFWCVNIFIHIICLALMLFQCYRYSRAWLCTNLIVLLRFGQIVAEKGKIDLNKNGKLCGEETWGAFF